MLGGPETIAGSSKIRMNEFSHFAVLIQLFFNGNSVVLGCNLHPI